MTQHLDTQLHISLICDQIKDLLLEKNHKYGDSALTPARIFSKADATEQLLVRIDDKLNRIQKGAGLLANDEDVINDLIGYLVLLKISLSRNVQQKTKYEDFVKNYSPELQLLEAFDSLSQYSEDEAASLDRLVSGPKDDKNASGCGHLDPTQES